MCDTVYHNKARYEEFRKSVEEFASYIIDGDVTFYESQANTWFGINNAFDENPDCELVFVATDTYRPQSEACKRGYLTFDWYSTTKKLVPTKVEDHTNDLCEVFSILEYKTYF